MKQILFSLLLVASLAAVSVKAQEEIEPIYFDIGQRVEGDMLLDMYYTSSEETAQPGTHRVAINWTYTDINFIRIYVEAPKATYEHTEIPASHGTITVTAEDVTKLNVYAYLYGTHEEPLPIN